MHFYIIHTKGRHIYIYMLYLHNIVFNIMWDTHYESIRYNYVKTYDILIRTNLIIFTPMQRFRYF